MKSKDPHLPTAGRCGAPSKGNGDGGHQPTNGSKKTEALLSARGRKEGAVAGGPVSRILSPMESGDGHSSRPGIAAGLERPTRESGGPSRPAPRQVGDSSPIWSCSVWGLPCPAHCCPGGALLPHLFTLTPMSASSHHSVWPNISYGLDSRSCLPRTNRGGMFSVALSVERGQRRRVKDPAPHIRPCPPGRYPAHCSLEFGLSSPVPTKRDGSDRPVRQSTSSL